MGERMVFYKSSFFNKELGTHAKRYSKAIPDNVKGLVSIGTSGCSIASAILATNENIESHVCFRKPGEAAQSHGGSCAGVPHRNVNYAIVDDFYSTGATIKGVLAKAALHEIRVTHVIVDHIVGRSRGDHISCDDGQDSERVRKELETYNVIFVNLTET